MALTSQIQKGDIAWLEQVQNEHVDILIVLDHSGSMSGKPWQQVQNAVRKICRLVEELKHQVDVCFLIYAENGYQLFSEEEILNSKAKGGTNFVAAFKSIEDHLKTYQLTLKKEKLVVIFMTDGFDTCNGPNEIAVAMTQLQECIEDLECFNVVFHVLGFTSQHNDHFLETLSILGTADGSYSFVPEDITNDALENRLYDLVHGAVSLVGKTAFIRLTFDEKSGHKFLGHWFGTVDGTQEVTLHVSFLMQFSSK